MKQLVIKCLDGTTIYVQPKSFILSDKFESPQYHTLWNNSDQSTLRPRESGGVRKSKAKEGVDKIFVEFKDIGAQIKSFSSSIVKSFQEIEEEFRPNKVKAEFGINFEGSANVVIAESTVGCSLKITLEWEADSK